MIIKQGLGSGLTEPSKNSISEYDLKRLNSQYNIEVINRVKDVRPIIESSLFLFIPHIMKACLAQFLKPCQLEGLSSPLMPRMRSQYP